MGVWESYRFAGAETKGEEEMGHLIFGSHPGMNSFNLGCQVAVCPAVANRSHLSEVFGGSVM